MKKISRKISTFLMGLSIISNNVYASPLDGFERCSSVAIGTDNSESVNEEILHNLNVDLSKVCDKIEKSSYGIDDESNFAISLTKIGSVLGRYYGARNSSKAKEIVSNRLIRFLTKKLSLCRTLLNLVCYLEYVDIPDNINIFFKFLGKKQFKSMVEYASIKEYWFSDYRLIVSPAINIESTKKLETVFQEKTNDAEHITFKKLPCKKLKNHK